MLQVDTMKFAVLVSWLSVRTSHVFTEHECKELLTKFGATLAVRQSSLDDLMAAIFADAPNKG